MVFAQIGHSEAWIGLMCINAMDIFFAYHITPDDGGREMSGTLNTNLILLWLIAQEGFIVTVWHPCQGVCFLMYVQT